MINNPDLKVGNLIEVLFKDRNIKKCHGIVYTYELESEMLILNIADGKYQLINPNTIEKINLIQQNDISNNMKFPKVKQSLLEQRELYKINKRKNDNKNINKLVSLKGQLIYDEFMKTLPCKWNGQTIEILNSAVKIKAPNYNVVIGDNVDVVNRIKTMLNTIENKVNKMIKQSQSNQ